ncbi:MAG: type II toxin-antitoxin system VapC family toxin [Ilumatobacter fluminis]|uniref:type II toxin-antitoxin system VapC family toxin n=1 Tax=Ilumatobacter fluminis TaxID=467091 RepID=UPI0032EF469A
MIQVVDASAVVAALVDDSPAGRWCEQALQAGPLFAPHLMPFEVANIVRRLVLRGALDDTAGSLAIADIGRLAVELAPYESVAARVWELRDDLTAYDAAYVATAELIGGRLVTLDERLARAPGIACEVVTPG